MSSVHESPGGHGFNLPPHKMVENALVALLRVRNPKTVDAQLAQESHIKFASETPSTVRWLHSVWSRLNAQPYQYNHITTACAG